MFDEWKRRLADRRVQPGDGRALAPYRWWQVFSRSVFELDIPTAQTPLHYAVEIRHWGDRTDGVVRARLYRDGRQTAVSKLPARLPVPGGVIDVAVGNFGMRRIHLVADDGTERQLRPHPRSAEGLRERLDKAHPVVSRVIAIASVVIVLVSVVLAVLQLAGPISRIPIITDLVGTFESPVHLPFWVNSALLIATIVSSTERALRLRSSWLDNLAN